VGVGGREGSLRFHFELISSSLRRHFNFTSDSLRFHVEFTLISIRLHFDFTSDALRFHIDFTSRSLRRHVDFILISLRCHFDFVSVHLNFTLISLRIPMGKRENDMPHKGKCKSRRHKMENGKAIGRFWARISPDNHTTRTHERNEHSSRLESPPTPDI